MRTLTNVRLSACGLFLATVMANPAADHASTHLIDDFEGPLQHWTVNQAPGAGQVEMAVSEQVHQGKGALKVTFLPWTEKTGHSEIISTTPGIEGGWPAYGEFEGIRFWFKGDGSKNVIFFKIAANAWKDNYSFTLPLESAEWRLIEIPWSGLTRQSGNGVFNPFTMQCLAFSVIGWFGVKSCPGVTFYLDDLELYRRQPSQPSQSTNPDKDFTPPICEKGPDLDGVLNDPCWEKAARLTFPMTTALVTHDGHNLYLAFACDEPQIAKLRRDSIEHDSGVFTDDCIEVFLDPHHELRPYYHLAINSQGAVYDAKIADRGWDPTGWKTAARVGAKEWTVEISIPFASLEPELGFGAKWRVNFCRTRCASGQTQLFNWAGFSGLFHQPDLFGIMNLREDTLRKYAALAVKNVVLPGSKAELGSNRAELTIASLADVRQTLTLKAECVSPSGGKDNVRKQVTLPPKKISTIPIDFPLRESGINQLYFAIEDEGGTTLALSRMFRMEIPDALSDIRLAAPAYHLTLYRGSATEEAPRLTGTFRLRRDVAKRHRLDITVSNEGTERLRIVKRITNDRFAWSVPTDKLGSGWHEIRLALTDASSQVVARREFAFNVAADKPGKVWGRDNRTIMVGDTPFFPFGWFVVPDSEADFKKVKDAGYNLVLNANFSDWLAHNPDAEKINNNAAAAAYLDRAQQHGLKVLMMFDRSKILARDTGYVAERVKALREHPALFGWYPFDEPDCLSVPVATMRLAYETIVKHDPYHPVFVVISKPQYNKDYLVATDILSNDPYPINDSAAKAGNTVANVTREAVSTAAAVNKSVLMTLQGCQLISSPNARPPTVAEVRNMTWQAILRGSTGILYYAYKCYRDIVFNTPGLWEGVAEGTKDIRRYESFILAPENPAVLKCNIPQTDVMISLRSMENKHAIFVVNLTEKDIQNIEITIPTRPTKGQQLVTSHAAISLKGSAIVVRDSLKPLGVNLYRFDFCE